MRLLDVRHEQTAAFAAEATGKLTRVPGLAVLTAGPGRHQRRQRHRAGPVRRLPDGRGRRPRPGRTAGAPAACRSSTSRRSSRRSPKPARTLHTAARRRSAACDEAFRLAGARTAARSSSTCRWTSSSTPPPGRRPPAPGRRRSSPTATRSTGSPGCWPRRERPVLILGTDVWADGAEEAALRLVERPRHPRRSPTAWAAASSPAATRCWSPRPAAQALGGADLVVVVGTPLDFRLGYGVFGGKDGRRRAARVVHVADSPGQVSRPRRPRRLGLAATSPRSSTACTTAVERRAPSRTGPRGSTELQDDRARRPPSATRALLGAEADPIHPARIYGELVPRLADDSVVIGDGGDFVSFAGKFVEPQASRRLAGPRPLRLPRRRPRARRSRPGSPGRPPRSCCCSATAPPASR